VHELRGKAQRAKHEVDLGDSVGDLLRAGADHKDDGVGRKERLAVNQRGRTHVHSLRQEKAHVADGQGNVRPKGGESSRDCAWAGKFREVALELGRAEENRWPSLGVHDPPLEQLADDTIRGIGCTDEVEQPSSLPTASEAKIECSTERVELDE